MSPEEKAKLIKALFGIAFTIVSFVMVSRWLSTIAPIITPDKPSPSTQEQVKIFNDDMITVPAKSWKSIRFLTPPSFTNGRVIGTIKAAGGSRDDIQVLILNEDQFHAFSQRAGTRTLFNKTGHHVPIEAFILVPDAYYLVFDNRTSSSSKMVQGDVEFVCYSDL